MHNMHNFYSISQKTLVNCFHICLIIRYIPAGFKAFKPLIKARSEGLSLQRDDLNIEEGGGPASGSIELLQWKVSGSKAGVMIML